MKFQQKEDDMEKILWTLQNSQLFSGIAEGEIREMLGCLDAGQRRFQKRDYIFRTGDTTETIGLLLSGTAFILHDDFWGNRNILSTTAPGQTFAETFACAPGTVMTVSVIAETDCEVLFLNVRRILTVCSAACSHHSRIIRNLLSDLAQKNLAYNEKMRHMAQRTTRAKLLSYFSAAAQRNNSVEFDIPFSRQQMADYLSVERSGLSMELSRMKRDGLLDYHKNHFILKRQEEGTVGKE